MLSTQRAAPAAVPTPALTRQHAADGAALIEPHADENPAGAWAGARDAEPSGADTAFGAHDRRALQDDPDDAFARRDVAAAFEV